MKRNPKFELTSAEKHVISYYGSQNESEKDSSENTSDTRDGIFLNFNRFCALCLLRNSGWLFIA